MLQLSFISVGQIDVGEIGKGIFHIPQDGDGAHVQADIADRIIGVGVLAVIVVIVNKGAQLIDAVSNPNDVAEHRGQADKT